MQKGLLLEVPDYDICLEAHEGPLAGGQVLATLGNGNHRDLVVVSSQEGLCSGNDVPDNDG